MHKPHQGRRVGRPATLEEIRARPPLAEIKYYDDILNLVLPEVKIGAVDWRTNDSYWKWLTFQHQDGPEETPMMFEGVADADA